MTMINFQPNKYEMIALDYLYNNLGYGFLLEISYESQEKIIYDIISKPQRYIEDKLINEFIFINYNFGNISKIEINKNTDKIISKPSSVYVNRKIEKEFMKLEKDIILALLNIEDQQKKFGNLALSKYSLNPVSTFVYEIFDKKPNRIILTNLESRSTQKKKKWLNWMKKANLLVCNRDETKWTPTNILNRLYEKENGYLKSVSEISIGIVLYHCWNELIEKKIVSFKPYFEISASYWLNILKYDKLIPLKISDLYFRNMSRRDKILFNKRIDVLVDAKIFDFSSPIDSEKSIIGDNNTFRYLLNESIPA